MTSRTPAVALRLVTGGPDLDQIRALLREYNHHLSRFLPPSVLHHREAELASLPGAFLPPSGALLLATAAGQPAGCAALRPLVLPAEPAAAEFCRLWVSPHARGLALGQLLLQTAIDRARTAGYTALLLNSVPAHMASAQTLYQRAGFHPTPPYKPIPIAGIQYFRLNLHP